MFIKIDLRIAKDKDYSKKFPISLKDLENAVNTCYLGLGTPYQPIDVDNFVDLNGNQFPDIPENAKITLKLQPQENDYQYRLNDPVLVCCKVKNVGRAFNDKDDIPKNYWEKIFDCNHKQIYSAPDGTLYIAPNKDNACIISTKKDIPDSFVSYSIIFSLIIKHKDGYKRRYYFILDPVVRISSNPPVV